MPRIYIFPWNVDTKKIFSKESNKRKIYKYETFYVQDKYFHKMEALKRFRHNTYMSCYVLAMLSQVFIFTNTVTNHNCR